MWPRVVEVMLAAWLAASPFILRLDDPAGAEALRAYACAAIVATASCLAYWPPTANARWATVAVGLWLAVRAYLVAAHPASPMIQNEFLVGLLLVMFAIVPNDILRPPPSWRRFTIDHSNTPVRR